MSIYLFYSLLLLTSSAALLGASPPRIGFIGWDDRVGNGGDNLGIGDTT
jgi:hypothetical protein